MDAYGFTGNIGCGKSTVSTLLAKYSDIVIFDTDSIAKEILRTEVNKQLINDIMQKNVFPSGTIDFRSIAEIIFSDHGKRTALELVIHPLTLARIGQEIWSLPESTIPIVEAAIIFEKHWEKDFWDIIVATCDEQEQTRRLLENRQMTMSQITVRKNAQLPSSTKERLSKYVINTHCDLKELEHRVHTLYLNLKNDLV